MDDMACLCTDLCSSGVPQPDPAAVLLLMTLPLSADSVSLGVGLLHLSSFSSNDSRDARDPEFSLESLPGRRRTRV